MELDYDSGTGTIGSLTKKYYYSSNSQILAQDISNGLGFNKYFYLHDRLGSVRMLIDTTAAVKNTYTYNQYGEDIDTECTETVDNPWKYTGQYYDKEIAQYYLRARQYDPQTTRFTGRDPIIGDFEESMTLHAYLYCLNDPINLMDLSGQFSAAEIQQVGGVQGWLVRGLTSKISKKAIFGGLQGGIMSFFNEEEGFFEGAAKGALSGVFGAGTDFIGGKGGILKMLLSNVLGDVLSKAVGDKLISKEDFDFHEFVDKLPGMFVEAAADIAIGKYTDYGKSMFRNSHFYKFKDPWKRALKTISMDYKFAATEGVSQFMIKVLVMMAEEDPDNAPQM